MLKKSFAILAASLIFTACTEPETENPDPNANTCTVTECIDTSTLKVCANGIAKEEKCASNEFCNANTLRCDPKTTDPTPENPNPETPNPETPNPDDNPTTGCTVGLCDAELSKTYQACHSGTYVPATCPEGEACLGGGCVPEFEEGTPCEDADGMGYCAADGQNAVVCSKKKLVIWTCKAPCSVDADGYVDCPKKAPTTSVDECNPKTYTAECINGGANVRLCVDRKIVTWNCAGNICSVSDTNEISCPKNEGMAGTGGLTSGGTFGDSCNMNEYQEACIDKYFARICDAGIVRIKPAGECKLSASNPKKVEYSGTSACDVQTQIEPFCINDGQAMGVCTFDEGTTETGYFKAYQCPDCDNKDRAIACMML